MLNKLKSLFAKTPVAEATMPATSKWPTTPLEILTPEDCQLQEPPKFAGKFISYLVASPNDINSISIAIASGHIHSTDQELQQFLNWAADTKQLDALLQQCRSVMFASSIEGELGSLGCIQQPHFHSFAVFESSPPPNLSWELRRQTRVIQPGSDDPTVR